ncbi:MAG: carbohydrate ABC transporter permease [Clostridia bacterium]|nr:carbohydrate ABC transporter permease [Clostridia bacterium]
MTNAKTKVRTHKKITPAMVKKHSKSVIAAILRYTLLICLSYLILAPILSNIVVAVTHPADLGLSSSIWIPMRLSTQNMHVAYLILNYSKTLPSTLLYTVIVMLLQVACTLLAGYSFARLKFKGQGVLFACVIATILVPSQIIMLPQYLYFSDFRLFGLIPLYNEGKGLNLLNQPAIIYILSALGMGLKSGLYIYIFRQTFRGLPKELEQAAYVDGAGFVRTFFRIVLPCAGPGLITVGTLSFVWNWNDTSFLSWFDPRNANNLMFMYIKRTANMKQALDGISSKVPGTYTYLTDNILYQNAINKTCALAVLIPLIILYLIVQRRFVQGVERSGIVG